MGNISSQGLAPRTQEAIEEWWGDREAGDACDELFASSAAVDLLLAHEPLAAAGFGSSTETGLVPADVAELAARVQDMASALDAGVAPRDAAAVVEHLVAELSSACSAPAPAARRLQRRRLVLRGLHAHLAAARLASGGTLGGGDGAEGLDGLADAGLSPPSLLRTISVPAGDSGGAVAAATGHGTHNTEWPSEYNTTQQVRRKRTSRAF